MVTLDPHAEPCLPRISTVLVRIKSHADMENELDSPVLSRCAKLLTSTDETLQYN